jgi:hypothetical protein
MGRLLLAIALILATAGLTLGPTWRVAAQDSGAQVVVERPLPGTSISVQASISGWAVDPAGPGTGVDAVHVYLDGEPGQPRARFLGQASYGQPRPDVARTLGDARFTNSGFALLSELPPGTHSLYVYAHTAGAGPQEGWTRGSVASFETSLIEAVATVVQPGPTPAGDTGRYQTGQASWQGGNTCVRYTGAGSCEASIPVGVASGASCIQWNQRGQCTNYVGGVDGAASSPPPTPSVRSVPPGGPPSVPTITSGGPPRPPVGAPRAVAPPPEAPSSDEAAPEPEAESSGPPQGALPAAAPPGGAEESLPAVRVAAPPPAAPLAAGAARTRPPADAGTTAAAPPPSGARSRAAGAAPTPVVVLAPAASGGASTGPVDEAIPADAPPPVADLPQVQATAAALRATNAAAGVAPLRSGCAMYIGCGGDAATPAPVATRPPVTPAPLSSAAVPPAGAAGLSPNLLLNPTVTVTPTACPPFGGCGPVAR